MGRVCAWSVARFAGGCCRRAFATVACREKERCEENVSSFHCANTMEPRAAHTIEQIRGTGRSFSAHLDARGRRDTRVTVVHEPVFSSPRDSVRRRCAGWAWVFGSSPRVDRHRPSRRRRRRPRAWCNSRPLPARRATRSALREPAHARSMTRASSIARSAFSITPMRSARRRRATAGRRVCSRSRPSVATKKRRNSPTRSTQRRTRRRSRETQQPRRGASSRRRPMSRRTRSSLKAWPRSALTIQRKPSASSIAR